MKYPKLKFRLVIDVIEDFEGKHSVAFNIEEAGSTMKEVGLALYKMKQVEQELIDRDWDNGGEGYEIIKDDDEGEE